MKNFLVIGLGEFGKSVARTLYKNGNTVLALDSSEELVRQALEEEIVDEAIILDVTDETTLKNVIKDDFDVSFVCIGTNIQSSILVTLQLKELGIKKIICKAVSHTQGKVLKKIGADMVVYPEESMGEKIALASLRPTVVEHFRFSEEYSVFEIIMPEDFIGKTLKELDLRNKYEANVMALKYSDGTMNVTPNPNDILRENDMLIMLLKTEMIDRIIK
ncbi:TrkA family potassium uptake protein [Streptobacillus felis]|uniref:TrkA family potassium uptake protein n=1 Tax=Streptobacillus felis TaxID=1384509 RepID=A0A7Z0T7X2_9FUSO|nr:TrkA family potassium uptake protein [Streptobacillus felis]NYV27274.1 TrkA family potassium uptake protein [Streptobacillus felis]